EADPATCLVAWEREDFVRRVRLAAPAEVWSFAAAARILYEPPAPAGATFHVGDVLTVRVVTQRRFKGGRLLAWDPFAPAPPAAAGGGDRPPVPRQRLVPGRGILGPDPPRRRLRPGGRGRPGGGRPGPPVPRRPRRPQGAVTARCGGRRLGGRVPGRRPLRDA